MKIKNIKKWLKGYTEDKIEISRHIKVDRAYRGISGDLIKKYLLNPENLERVVEVPHDKENETKFKVRFEISRSKSLGVVIILNEVLKIITTYIINKKWQRLWKKKS